MKIIANILTVLAGIGGLLGVGMLDSAPMAGITLLYVSLIVLTARCYLYEQKRIREGKR